MGKEFASPEDAYTDTHWRPRLLDVDLTWTTDGIPYHYDLTTRYEIPCLVTGTVTIEGETFAVDGQGQRDHSWGVRDWWAFGWCWCSLRLDDGTGSTWPSIRMIPDVPVFFGYIKTPGDVHPVTALSVTEDVGDQGSRPRPASRSPPHPGTTSASMSIHRDRARAPAQRRRPDEPVPPGDGDVPARRRPVRIRLIRVEPARPRSITHPRRIRGIVGIT